MFVNFGAEESERLGQDSVIRETWKTKGIQTKVFKFQIENNKQQHTTHLVSGTCAKSWAHCLRS